MLARFSVVAFAVALVSACATTAHPRIADIKYNPGR